MSAATFGKFKPSNLWRKDERPSCDHVRVLRAFRPGDIVFIECERRMSDEEMAHIRASFSEHTPDIKVIVLGPGMHVAAREEMIATETT